MNEKLKQELEQLAAMASVAKDDDELNLQVSGDALRYLIGGAQAADVFLAALGSTAARFADETGLDPEVQKLVMGVCLAIAENPMQVLQDNRKAMIMGSVPEPEAEKEDEADESSSRFARMDLN